MTTETQKNIIWLSLNREGYCIRYHTGEQSRYLGKNASVSNQLQRYSFPDAISRIVSSLGHDFFAAPEVVVEEDKSAELRIPESELEAFDIVVGNMHCSATRLELEKERLRKINEISSRAL